MPDHPLMARREGLCAVESGGMICRLPEGHEGLHYDDIDDISWKEGKPDA